MAGVNRLKYQGVSERILQTKEIDMGIDPVTGRRMVKLVIDDPYYRNCGSSGAMGIPSDNYGSSGAMGIPSNNYGTSGFVDLKESSFYESSFMDINSESLTSIHNWELHQKLLPKTKIETELRKDFFPKKQEPKNKVSNNPVKIEKKKTEPKKKKDIKKIANPILTALSGSLKLLFPISFISKIINKNRW